MSADTDYVLPLCRLPDADPEDWFAWPGSDRSRKAKQTCMDCPLYWDCQAKALDEGVPYGVWGGLDERDRARIWRRNGGRPTAFQESIDAVIGPSVNARTMRESWARRNADPDDYPFTYGFAEDSDPDAA